MASAVTGYIGTYGVDEPAGCYDDLDTVRRAHHLGQQPRRDAPGAVPPRRRPADCAARRSRIIDIATRRTRTSGSCRARPALQPQTRPGHRQLASRTCSSRTARSTRTSSTKHCDFRAPRRRARRPLAWARPITFDEYKRAGRRVHAREASSRSPGCPAEHCRMLGRAVRRPRTADHQPVVHGDEPAHARAPRSTTSSTGIHLLSGHFGKPGDGPHEPHRAAVRVRHGARGRHALPRAARAACGSPTPTTARRPRTIWNLPAGAINPQGRATTPSRCGRSSARRPTRAATSTRSGCR